MAGFYSQLFQKLNDSLTTYIGSTVAQVVGAIAPSVTLMLGIYTLVWGWLMMRGAIQEPILDGAERILKLGFIVGLATASGLYSSFIADWLWQSPDALATAVSGSSGQPNVLFLDTLWEQSYDFGEHFMTSAQATKMLGVPDLSKFAAAIGIWIAGLLCTGYAAFVLALAKISLAMLIGIGPIFIALLMFQSTRKFFDAWMGQAVTYVFLVLLTATAIRLILTILQAYLTKYGEVIDPGVSEAMPAIAFSCIGFLVLMQLPSLAAALGGGVAVSTLGAVNYALSRSRRATAGVFNIASGRTLSAIRGARRQRSINAAWAGRNPGLAYRTATLPAAAYRRIRTPKDAAPASAATSTPTST